jgi:hypothetical protein
MVSPNPIIIGDTRFIWRFWWLRDIKLFALTILHIYSQNMTVGMTHMPALLVMFGVKILVVMILMNAILIAPPDQLNPA